MSWHFGILSPKIESPVPLTPSYHTSPREGGINYQTLSMFPVNMQHSFALPLIPHPRLPSSREEIPSARRCHNCGEGRKVPTLRGIRKHFRDQMFDVHRRLCDRVGGCVTGVTQMQSGDTPIEIKREAFHNMLSSG